MAVPASGNSLSLGSIAFEKLEDDYDQGAAGTIDPSYGPFSLRDVTLGGATTVGAEDYDVTNAISPSHPDNDASYGMSEFYSYDHDFAAPGCNIAYYEGNNGEFNYPIDLGSAQGNVTIEYQAYSKIGLGHQVTERPYTISFLVSLLYLLMFKIILSVAQM